MKVCKVSVKNKGENGGKNFLSPYCRCLSFPLLPSPHGNEYWKLFAHTNGLWNYPLEESSIQFLGFGMIEPGFRSQAESYYGRYVFNTPFALRDFVGVSDIESLGPYGKTQWRDYQRKLLGKT